MGKTGGKPLHLRTIGRSLLGDEDLTSGKNGGKPRKHPVGTTEDPDTKRGIGLVEPCGETDSPGNLIQFADREPLLRQHKIRPDHPGDLTTECSLPSQCHDTGWLSPVEQAEDPFGLASLDALAVEQVAGIGKLKQAMSHGLEFLGQLGIQAVGNRRPSPLLPCKELSFGHPATKLLQGEGWFGDGIRSAHERRCLRDSRTTSSAEESAESLVRTAFTALWASTCL